MSPSCPQRGREGEGPTPNNSCQPPTVLVNSQLPTYVPAEPHMLLHDLTCWPPEPRGPQPSSVVTGQTPGAPFSIATEVLVMWGERVLNRHPLEGNMNIVVHISDYWHYDFKQTWGLFLACIFARNKSIATS